MWKLSSLSAWSLLVAFLYLPVAPVCVFCAVVELEQLSTALGQKEVDLSGTTRSLWLWKENLSEILRFISKDQHHPAQVCRKRDTGSSVCLLAKHKDICSDWFWGHLQKNSQETSPFHQEWPSDKTYMASVWARRIFSSMQIFQCTSLASDTVE